MGALLIDKKFRQVANYASDANDLCYGIDAFMRDVVVIPPRQWHLQVTLEPNEKIEEAYNRDDNLPPSRIDQTKVTMNLDGLQYTGRYAHRRKKKVFFFF